MSDGLLTGSFSERVNAAIEEALIGAASERVYIFDCTGCGRSHRVYYFPIEGQRLVYHCQTSGQVTEIPLAEQP